MDPFCALPIDDAMGELRSALDSGAGAVLVAPPGAGKTTRTPLELMREPWTQGRKLILLEPRRLAARAAAARMAQTLGEDLGETIGLRVRLETRVSRRTRIEVVTEGVFARMIVDDPELSGVAGVLFDEFHERSLDADLGLALALDARAALREDLRLLVMSATLDGAGAARLLNAPLIESAGRAFPVETFYVGRDPAAKIEEQACATVLRAFAEQSGSILVFLPGAREIERASERLSERLPAETIIAPLHGALDRGAQDRALRPAPPGRRKVVLATSIAETSLTIEGVRIVIDAGLARLPRYEPGLGLTRLETVRASRASVDQRRGRAGRTEPGACYRLWEEAANGSLPPFTPPEMLAADLSGLVLDLAAWGARNPYDLAWLDPPPRAALDEARATLRRLGAIDPQGAITEDGRAMRALPLPPRLARMTALAASQGRALQAAETAVVLSERAIGSGLVDVAERVRRLRSDRSRSAEEGRRLAKVWANVAASNASGVAVSDAESDGFGRLVAVAFPDRVAKARGKLGDFLMANGRAASLDPIDPLAREAWLAIADVSGRAGAQRILAAAALSSAEVLADRSDVDRREESWFDRDAAALRRRSAVRLGAIQVSERPLPTLKGPQAAIMLARGIAELGLDRLPWTPDLLQLRDRILFLRALEGEEWPDVSQAALARSAENWLAPFIEAKDALGAIESADLQRALKALLDWRQSAKLDAEAPTHFQTPAGSLAPIDYAAEGGPALHVRVQELFGLSRHPTVASGKAKLTLHLLSPARRPIQITRDLERFWAGSWGAVAAEMRGRYPKHLWPDHPATAIPTFRAKPRR